MHRKTLSENQIQNNCLMVLLFSILLLQDAKKSQNEETVDDPLTWTVPWTVSVAWAVTTPTSFCTLHVYKPVSELRIVANLIVPASLSSTIL